MQIIEVNKVISEVSEKQLAAGSFSLFLEIVKKTRGIAAPYRNSFVVNGDYFTADAFNFRHGDDK